MKKSRGSTLIDREASADLNRVVSLSDGIFAFALTLLALDLRLPASNSLTIDKGLIDLLPNLLIFLISFLNYWESVGRSSADFPAYCPCGRKVCLAELAILAFCDSPPSHCRDPRQISYPTPGNHLLWC